MRKKIFTLVCVICCVAFFSEIQVRAAGMRINGTIVFMGGRASGRSLPFSLIVNSYTPPNQVSELNNALAHGGQDELLKALSHMDAGRIQVGTGVGVTANVIIAEPYGEGGLKLTVLYERNLGFNELRYGTRSSDYRVGYAELYLDRNGKGEGMQIGAAKVRLKGGNTWEVEDFGVFPSRLLGLTASGTVPVR